MPPRVAQCPVALEATLVAEHRFDDGASALEAAIQRVHAPATRSPPTMWVTASIALRGARWERHRFFDGEPLGIDRLNGFIGRWAARLALGPL